MNKQVTNHALAWNVRTGQGAIRVIVKDVAQPVDVPIRTPQEFAALAILLRESQVFADPDTGLISTNWSDTGGFEAISKIMA